MDPAAPPQPSKDAAYQTKGNPVSSDPIEHQAAQQPTSGGSIAERFPNNGKPNPGEATPSSLGYGIHRKAGTHGAPAGKEVSVASGDRSQEMDGEQMRAPGEGSVADAVKRKPGAGGSQPDLANDLDRKKAEQAPMREAIKELKKQGMSSDCDPRAAINT